MGVVVLPVTRGFGLGIYRSPFRMRLRGVSFGLTGGNPDPDPDPDPDPEEADPSEAQSVVELALGQQEARTAVEVSFIGAPQEA